MKLNEAENSSQESPLKKFLKSAGSTMLVPILAVLTALIIGGIVIATVGGNPFQAYLGLFQGAFGSAKAWSETAVWASPYIFAGLAVALAFKGGLFNIGAEGQLALGAVVAAWIGYALPDVLGISLPAIIGKGNTDFRSVFDCWPGIPRKYCDLRVFCRVT